MLDSTQVLSLYQKWGCCSSFINLQYRHAGCLSVAFLHALSGDSCLFVCLKEDFTHQSGKWRLTERDPRSIRIKWQRKQEGVIWLVSYYPVKKVTSNILVSLCVGAVMQYLKDWALLEAEGKDTFLTLWPISTSIALHICYKHRFRECAQGLGFTLACGLRITPGWILIIVWICIAYTYIKLSR